jgi:hypothetical protein
MGWDLSGKSDHLNENTFDLSESQSGFIFACNFSLYKSAGKNKAVRKGRSQNRNSMTFSFGLYFDCLNP